MMALLCVTAAWAETVTFDFSQNNDPYGVQTGGDFVNATLGGVTLTGIKGTSTNSPRWYNTGTKAPSLRVYKGNSLSFTSSSDYTITKIVFADALASATADPDGYNSGTNTWSGNANSITITNPSTGSTWYIKSIEVTYTPASSSSVATPVISFSNDNPYAGDNVTCTITCETTDAALEYKLNNGEYQAYTQPFTLTETTTVYAKAALNGEESAVAENTITFTDITTVANIAALTQLSDDTEFRMTGSATVVYVSGNWLYIKDNSGSTLLYDVTQDGIAAGNTISNLMGKVSIYNGLFEVGKPASYDVEATSVTVDPVVMAVGDITNANINQYVKLEGVTLSALDSNGNYFTINDGALQGRHRFGDVYPTNPTGKTFNVTGFVGYNNNSNGYDFLQFWPIAYEDVTPAVFGIAVTPTPGEFTAPVNVSIQLLNATDDAIVTYKLDDGNEIDYTAPFTLYKNTTVTVNAINGDMTEAEWTGTYTINLPELAFTTTPAPGSYMGPQNVTINSNAVSDLTVVWSYTPTEGETINGDDSNMTFTAASTGVLSIMAEEANTGREFEGTFNYTINPIPSAATYFKLVTDLSELEEGKQVLIAGIKNNGPMYVMGQQNSNNRGAVEVSDAAAAPETIDLADVEGYYPMLLGKEGSNYTFYDFLTSGGGYLSAANSSSNHMKLQQTLNDNGKAAITLEDGVFSVVFQGNYTKNDMRFNASSTCFSCYGSTTNEKHVYLYVETTEPTPVQTYTITLDNEPGDYSTLVNVKATVEPALPEGATLKYAIDDAEPVAYNAEKGVNLLKSCNLTFTAYAADGTTVLATAGGQYKYVVNVFGDVDGDGKVTVSDMNIIINLILSKY